MRASGGADKAGWLPAVRGRQGGERRPRREARGRGV